MQPTSRAAKDQARYRKRKKAAVRRRRVPPARSPAAPSPPSPRGTALEEAIETLAGLKQTQTLAREQGAEIRDLVTIARAITDITRLIAKLQGEFDVSLSQLLRSSHWRELRMTIVNALTPIDGALEALNAVFNPPDEP